MIPNVRLQAVHGFSAEIISQQTLAHWEKEKKYSDPSVIQVMQECIQKKEIRFEDLQQGFSFIHNALHKCTTGEHTQLYKKIARQCIEIYKKTFEVPSAPVFILKSVHESVEISQALLDIYIIPSFNNNSFQEGQPREMTLSGSYGKQTLAIFKSFLETQIITSTDIDELMALHDLACFLKFSKLQKAVSHAIKKAQEAIIERENVENLEQLKKYAEEEQLLRQAFFREPNNLTYLDKLALNFFSGQQTVFSSDNVKNLERCVEAEHFCREVLGLVSDKSFILLILGSILSQQADFLSDNVKKLEKCAEAEQLCRQARSLKPDDSTYLNKLASILSQQADLLSDNVKKLEKCAEAEQLCKKALILEPTNPTYLNKLVSILSQQARFLSDNVKKLEKCAEAEQLCKKALILEPNNLMYLNNLIEILLHQAIFSENTEKLAKYAEAEKLYKSNLEIKYYLNKVANDEFADGFIVDYAEELKKYADAEQLYMSDRNNPEYINNFARSLSYQASLLRDDDQQKLEKYAEAIRLYKRVYAHNPANLTYLNNLVYTLFVQASLLKDDNQQEFKNYDDAKRFIERNRHAKGNPLYFKRLALILSQQAILLKEDNPEKLKKYIEAEHFIKKACPLERNNSQFNELVQVSTEQLEKLQV